MREGMPLLPGAYVADNASGKKVLFAMISNIVKHFPKPKTITAAAVTTTAQLPPLPIPLSATAKAMAKGDR